MNKSIRWVVLAIVVGIVAIGGTWAGLSFNGDLSDNDQTPASSSDDAAASQDATTSDTTDATQSGTTSSSENNSSEEAQSNTDNGNQQTASDEIDVLIGDGLIEVDKIEIRTLEVNDADADAHLDEWLGKQAPEASRSIIRRWMREDRVAVNNELISQANHQLSSQDVVQFTFTEFSALKLYISEQLANPFREEYDLFLLTITGQYIKNNHIQYLGVGPLFGNDIARVPGSMKGRDGLPDWQRTYYTADFGEYRFYELE